MSVSQSSTVWWYAKWLFGEKEKSRESKAKDTMVKTETETSCQESFRQKVTRILGGKNGLPDEWDKTAEMLRKTAETILGETFRKRKGDKETWWWNEEVQKRIKKRKRQRKHGAK